MYRSKFGKPSDDEYCFEVIEINALILSKNYQEKLISSNAHVKYYVADKDDPAVTFLVPNEKLLELLKQQKMNGQHGQQYAQILMNLIYLNPYFLKMVFGGQLVKQMLF